MDAAKKVREPAATDTPCATGWSHTSQATTELLFILRHRDAEARRAAEKAEEIRRESYSLGLRTGIHIEITRSDKPA